MLATLCLSLALSSSSSYATLGEPNAGLDNSGFPVPFGTRKVDINSATVEVSMPRNKPVHVRADIEFRPTTSSVVQALSLPTEGTARVWQEKTGWKAYPVTIKLDGKRIAFKSLDYDDLTKPTIDKIVARMDAKLKDRPELYRMVKQLRQRPEKDFFVMDRTEGGIAHGREYAGQSDYLAQWLAAHYGSSQSWENIAGGLLLRTPAQHGGLKEYFIQSAFQWLDTTYQPSELWTKVRSEWGFESQLFNPWKGRLENVGPRMIMEDEIFISNFKVLRFNLPLKTGVPHRLTIEYDEDRSWVRREYQGFCYYLATAAKKWNGAATLRAQVRFPAVWKKAAVYPKADSKQAAAKWTTFSWTMPLSKAHNVYGGS